MKNPRFVSQAMYKQHMKIWLAFNKEPFTVSQLEKVVGKIKSKEVLKTLLKGKLIKKKRNSTKYTATQSRDSLGIRK
ncbi:hypothetical protein KW805_01090 [Candidatus Pacearchaeota archaeon]|nr:hypothetical protein [Candidatus Pacearchaeota archaeon]